MGRHSAPRKSKKPVFIKGATVLAMATAPAGFTTGTANAASTDSILAAIASCESGNRNVLTGITDRSGRRLSTAGGYWQIVNGTWRAHGGTQFAPIAVQASYSEQLQVARRILTQGQGIGAWSESKSCWSRRIGQVALQTPAPEPVKKPAVKVTPTTPVKKAESAPKTIKKQTAPPTKATAKKAARSYVIKRGDSLVKIAARNGTTWRKLYALNRDSVRNPALIYTGNTLRLR